MSHSHDPWTRWYQAYVDHRAMQRLASERRKAANVMAGLLISYMLLGGVMASIAVALVMSH